MPYALGVDLGTSYTAAAVRFPDGRSEMVALTPHRPSIPTVVALDTDDRWIVGEPAERRARSAPERVAREFKRRLGDPAPAVLGTTPVPTEHLLAVVLADVVAAATRTLGEPPSHLTVTHPAAWAEHKRNLLAEAVATTGIDAARVSYLPEPVAAAIQYAGTERVSPGTAIAVYDLGGGTFDAAVVQRTDDGFTILGHPEGIERAGGLDIDQAVFDHVADSLAGALERLDADDPAVIGALGALRAECVQAKEALSTDSDTTVTVAVPGVHEAIRITRAELERRIEPMLRQTADALDRAIASTGSGPASIDRILLVGGSSRVPMVAQLLTNRFGRPVVVDAHPKHAIALGAAAQAGDRAFGRAAAPAWPTPADAPPSSPPPTTTTTTVPAGGAPARRRTPLLVAAAVVAVIAVVGAAVALGGGGGGGGDEEAITTTTDAAPTSTSTTTLPTRPSSGGDDRFTLPTRPAALDDAEPAAGLRGGQAFFGVDPVFLERVRQVDPTVDDAGIVAETYDATLTLLLAARQTGDDGSRLSNAIAGITRVGTPCTTAAECIAVLDGGGDPDYDGPSGRIELADGGERLAGRWQVFESQATGIFGDGFPEDVDVPSLRSNGEVIASDVHPDDGTLRIGRLVQDVTGPAAARMVAASQLAVDDITAAGGASVPVELVAPKAIGGTLDEDQAVIDELVAQGVDAVLVVDVPADIALAITDAGILLLQVSTTPASALFSPDDRPDDAPPLDGGLRFGFGPSHLTYGYMVAGFLRADECRDVALISGSGVDDTDEDDELWQLILEDNGLRVELVPTNILDPDDTTAVDEQNQTIVDAIAGNDCVVWAGTSLGVASQVAATVVAGVGPADTFQWLNQGVLDLTFAGGVANIVEELSD